MASKGIYGAENKFGEQILCVLCAFAVENPALQSTPRAQSYFKRKLTQY